MFYTERSNIIIPDIDELPEVTDDSNDEAQTLGKSLF